MKKLSTILALVLALCLAVPAMAAELVYNGELTTIELPIVEEPITISGMGSRFSLHGDWNEMPFFKGWSELTGINVEWEMIPQDGYGEKKNLKFASGEFPDLMFRAGINSNDRINYGVDSDGSIGLLALNDLIEQYGANIQAMYEEVPYARVQATQYNGMIYDLPRVEAASNDRLHVLWINQEWLTNLELAKPETLEELLNVMRAFRDQDANGNGDPTDEIVLTDFSSSIDRIMLGFKGSWGLGDLGMGQFNLDAEGNLEYERNTETWREFLRFMNTLYTEKLLDPDYFTNDSARYSALLAEDRVGFHQQCSTGDAGKNWYKWDALLPVDVPGYEDVKGYAHINNPVLETGTVAISCTNPYPVETFKMVDFLYSDEGFQLQNLGGLENVTYIIDEDGYYKTTNPDGSWIYETVAGIDMEYWGEATPYYGGSTPIWNKTREYKEERWPSEQNSALQWARNEQRYYAHELLISNYIDESVRISGLNFNAEDTEALKAFTDEGNDYITEMTMKFITGEASLDTDWDTYCQTLIDMGLENYIEIYTRNYDAVK